MFAELQSFILGSFSNNGSSILEEILSHKFPEWEEEAVSNMLFMDSPIYIVTLSMLYLAFVTTVGPKIMKHRKPFSLKWTMMAYNLGQVALNAWFLISFFSEEGMTEHLLKETFQPVIPARSKRLRLISLRYIWIWWLIKVSDLADTVIFVLRKKQTHVSFLHVYHHFNMSFFCWLYFKYIRGEWLIFAGLINSLVHIIMYSYYFLAALGPKLQPYLWWKKYLTRMQLVQFMIIFSVHVYLAIFQNVPTLQRLFLYFAISQTIIFTILFTNFYIKAYKRPSSKTQTGVKVKSN
ncbi:elongation of very long chain fatty acids protein 1-like [Macrosteles quadrilineatus]|uniref:elongation of very long chain fatty acids protein 1-like n=1 Tax=Macrosteles quadrilineatus TaxID=74068 RepID=UPI0023E23FF1|nr:elongation of very long chain fatty acids protein 1-like [Macrosteles quadrilineatus]XP_054287232.1 elongation of very long chain fatty acids protein 1-like [Macrosteles quadrilineatus]